MEKQINKIKPSEKVEENIKLLLKKWKDRSKPFSPFGPPLYEEDDYDLGEEDWVRIGNLEQEEKI